MPESAKFDTQDGGKVQISQYDSGNVATVQAKNDSLTMPFSGADRGPRDDIIDFNDGGSVIFKNETVADAALSFAKHLTE